MSLGGASHSGGVWGPEKARGRKGPHANVAPLAVAFRAALGAFLGNHTPKFAVFAHSTDATGTKGEVEGETTSIVASFEFSPPENPRVKVIPGGY